MSIMPISLTNEFSKRGLHVDLQRHFHNNKRTAGATCLYHARDEEQYFLLGLTLKPDNHLRNL